MHDPVNRPAHYTAHGSGVECIEISEHLCANLAQALQYVWPYKGRMAEDLAKARWFIVRECARRTSMAGTYLPVLDPDLHERFLRVIRAEGPIPTPFGAFVGHIRRAHFGPVYDCQPLHWALDELTTMVGSDARWWA